MYQDYFGFKSTPFSIVPDHRVVYMSASHKKAVAHLLYAMKQSGGFVQLTGEVGTGKTTVSRYLIEHLPDDVDVALLLNPRIDEREMLQAICVELGIAWDKNFSLRELINRLNLRLLESHARGRHTVLIIDEAQNLSREVLEQIRLLTNLETSTDKLLQIILIGQPELETILARHDLRQLAQRIIGRYRLEPLKLQESREYIAYRMRQAGCERQLFSRAATRLVHHLSGGIPRLINVLCDASLMAAFSQDHERVSWSTVRGVAGEVLPGQASRGWLGQLLRLSTAPLLVAVLLAGAINLGTEKQIGNLVAGIWPEEAGRSAAPTASSAFGAGGSSASVAGVGEQLAGGQGRTAVLAPDVRHNSTSRETVSSPDSRFDLIYRMGVPLNIH